MSARLARPERGLSPFAVVAGVAVVVLAVFLLVSRQGGGGEIEGLETFGRLEQTHVQGAVSYPQAPPVGGPHNPQWMNCGIYDTQVPNEYAVHSLEHGAVWIAYRPNLPEADVEALRSLARGRPYVLLAPYASGALDAPVAAVAWGYRLQVQSGDDPRLARFVQAYANGPQTPEPGAPCSGSFGSPVG